MSKNLRPKFQNRKPKKKLFSKKSKESYGAKLAKDFTGNPQKVLFGANMPSCTYNDSECSIDDIHNHKGPAFPFRYTPSGHLIVDSKQIVFQSSTVGVLLADPTQAKVKVKFDGKPVASCEKKAFRTEAQIQQVIAKSNNAIKNELHSTKSLSVREDKGKDLESLGYGVPEPVHWMQVQLPKKADLLHEFYRRIRNFINTDTLVHIGDESFHCHHIILEIYSTFFDENPEREIELPISHVTPEAFHVIYEWMVCNGTESNRILKRNNILNIYCAAQFLSVKGLEEQCSAFINNESLFSEDTAFFLYKEARAKGIISVMNLMVPRVMKFFLPLVASKDFLEMEAEEVIAFLSSNHICVTSELEVLMAAVRWLLGDWPARKRHTIDLMHQVRFGLVSPWQLVDVKRNPDNGEVLEIVNDPEVLQMVDDGLAYVIIKYWYGNNSQNYHHWIDVLGLTEPEERNWFGEEKIHITYKDFLKYLDQFMVPKEQMYQQMAMMQPAHRTDDIPGSMRGVDNETMKIRRQKFDFPLPDALKSLADDKVNSFPTDVFLNRKKPIIAKGGSPMSPVVSPSPKPTLIEEGEDLRKFYEEGPSHSAARKHAHVADPPERDQSELTTVSSGTSSQTPQTGEGRRYSTAACYLAAATAALTNYNSRKTQPSPPAVPMAPLVAPSEADASQGEMQDSGQFQSPQISLFDESKEIGAKINMNKLSISVLGPSNKNYICEGSLFNWDRETVLVFGGIDPHSPYGGKNSGKDVYRFDPIVNVWDNVGELPEPRHHHSVAFLKGRIYLVGGADPRDDDIRGRSAVVSTVWSYEPVSKSWFSESGLATPRKNFGLVVHKMALYAIGGQDKKGRVLRSVEKFDPKSGSWSEVRPMSVARMAVAATKYREYIWVAGGMTGEKKKPLSKVVECYNSRTNEWTAIHCLRFPRCFATLFSMNDKLYLVGGAGRLLEKEKTASSVGAIDVWDFKLREWRQHTEMSIPRHGHALAYLGTQLIIIGGVTTIYMRALSNVESYCCERGAWIRGVAPLPSPISGHGSVTLPPASLM